MSQSMQSEQLGADGHLKSYSCLPCRQRKVKCDRCTPCANCARAGSQCSFVPPVRGKRKRTKPPKESLHAKLKRYEELLKSYGVTVESAQNVDYSDSETVSRPDVDVDEDATPQENSWSVPYELEETESKLVTKEGTSRYFDSAPWADLGDNFQHPEFGGLPVEESNVHDSELLFEPEPNHANEDLASLHPSLQVLPKIRDIYVDRVDPIIKIFHIPTFWAALVKGLQLPQTMAKSFEAAVFAFYLATISTLKDEESQSLFGSQKSIIYPRYKAALRQALINAGFLSTSSLMTLRAYALFIMCVRNTYQSDALFVLSGISIRLARKMGLHRDGTSLGLSPFETEARRRLWWHLVHVDFRTADVLGTRPSLDLSYGDTKLPLNVDDQDLHSGMTDLPPERNGITSITVPLIKCEIYETLRKFSTTGPGDVRFEVLSNPDITLARKDSVIGQLEDHWERKYLRYCDPSNSLHTFVSIMIRATLCKMKLFAHNPRQFVKSPVEVPQSEHDIVFANATKLLEYVTLTQKGHGGLGKYMWQIGTSFLWNTMLYVLIEARHRKTGPEVDRAWQLIGEVLSHYPQVFEECAGAVYTALGKWTLEVWDNYIAAFKAEGLLEPPTPEYINKIRRCRRPTTESPSRTRHPAVDSGSATRTLFSDTNIQEKIDENSLEYEPFGSYDFPDLLSFEVDPNEWIQWEQLVAEQSGFAQVGSM